MQVVRKHNLKARRQAKSEMSYYLFIIITIYLLQLSIIYLAVISSFTTCKRKLIVQRYN